MDYLLSALEDAQSNVGQQGEHAEQELFSICEQFDSSKATISQRERLWIAIVTARTNWLGTLTRFQRAGWIFVKSNMKALYKSCQLGKLDALLLCLQGSDIDVDTIIEGYIHRNGTCLRVAAASGHLAIVQHLVEVAGSKDSEEAMITASQNGHVPVVEYFLNRGVSVNFVSSNNGRTALHFAPMHPGMVKFLLERGADVLLTDVHGNRAINMQYLNESRALLINHENKMKLAKEAQAKLDADLKLAADAQAKRAKREQLISDIADQVVMKMKNGPNQTSDVSVFSDGSRHYAAIHGVIKVVNLSNVPPCQIRDQILHETN